MPSTLEVSITAPVRLGDVVALVTLEGGAEQAVVLRDGSFRGELPARPLRLRLDAGPAPAGEAPLALPVDGEGTPIGTPVDVHHLFDEGVEIPADGKLVAQLAWGTPCHEEGLPEASGEGTRFGSWEHMMCAALVGLDDHGARLVMGGEAAWFDAQSTFAVGGKALAFGDVIALAGDFYAHLDARAATDFAAAWPALHGFLGWMAGDYRGQTLADDGNGVVQTILEVIRRDRDESRGVGGELAQLALDSLVRHYPARRYLALASQNYCHFAQLPSDGTTGDDAANEALQLYRNYHRRAVAEAAAAATAIDRSAAFELALATDAFGCHFLTDSFASGHMRVPRRVLGTRYGVLRGALGMSHAMHAEDNGRGLWCTTRTPGATRLVWRAYGDGMLRTPQAAAHLGRVQEAVRRSVAELFAAYRGLAVPAGGRAEDILPVPLAPGEGPYATDEVLGRSDGDPNHYPLYWARGDQVLRRTGKPGENLYVDQDERGGAAAAVSTP